MFTNTIAYNKARIELHAQALAYEKATDEEKENLPVGKLVPQEEITEELWSLLDSPPTPEQTEVSLDYSKGYPVPSVGLEITEDTVERFISTYSEWLVRFGLPVADWGKDRDGDRVTLCQFSNQAYLPWTVVNNCID